MDFRFWNDGMNKNRTEYVPLIPTSSQDLSISSLRHRVANRFILRILLSIAITTWRDERQANKEGEGDAQQSPT